GMLRTGVDLELAELLGTEAGVRQHALDGAAHGLLGSALEEIPEALRLEALGEAAVAHVGLRLALVGAHGDLRGVEDDHVIAEVEVRRPGRLVLALEDARDARGETTERLVRRMVGGPL